MGSALGDFLTSADYAGPRGLVALTREGSVAVELARGTRRRRVDRRARRGAAYARAGRLPVGGPVLLVPGFMAGDWSLHRMAGFLREQGLRTYRSGINVNAGCTTGSGDDLERRVERIAERRGTRVSIVGHSLGGMLARALAARRPDLVAGIVTMGSPVLAPAAVHQTLGWNAALLTRLSDAGFGGLMSSDCVAGVCARESFEMLQAPMSAETGYTAIYSRRDGIVDWHSCLDPYADHRVEVRTSHIGMAVDPVVLDHVAGALHDQRVARLDSSAAQEPSSERLDVGHGAGA